MIHEGKYYILLGKHRRYATRVDPDDYAALGRYPWGINHHGYVVRSLGAYGIVYMHRTILFVPTGKMCDHINGRTLDNRKENLRVVSPAVNARNRHDLTGVSFRTDRNKWRAYIGSNPIITIGHFDTKEEAMEARAAKQKELWGELIKP